VPELQNVFPVDERLSDAPGAPHEVLISGPPITCLNAEGSSPHAPLAIVPLRDVHNHLVYIRSSLGGLSMNLTDTVSGRHIGIYQYESDYFSDQTIAAMGRYLVFNVLNPSEKLRLVLDMTDTLRPDRMELPHPLVADSSTTKQLPVYGRGSARVISPPITPMRIDGQAFVALDMNREPYRNPEPPRTGLMRLFGTDIPLDPRRFVVYTRGISAISDAEYRALKPPSSIARFPEDLLDNRALEYSGLYEDGWASEEFSVRLSVIPGLPLLVKGVVPQIADPAFTTEATMFVDSAQVLRTTLSVGDFRLAVPAPKRSTVTVRIRFSRTQRLPNGDGRIVGALVHKVGTESQPVAQVR
jgi:hypothetical protein